MQQLQQNICDQFLTLTRKPQPVPNPKQYATLTHNQCLTLTPNLNPHLTLKPQPLTVPIPNL